MSFTVIPNEKKGSNHVEDATTNEQCVDCAVVIYRNNVSFDSGPEPF